MLLNIFSGNVSSSICMRLDRQVRQYMYMHSWTPKFHVRGHAGQGPNGLNSDVIVFTLVTFQLSGLNFYGGLKTWSHWQHILHESSGCQVFPAFHFIRPLSELSEEKIFISSMYGETCLQRPLIQCHQCTTSVLRDNKVLAENPIFQWNWTSVTKGLHLSWARPHFYGPWGLWSFKTNSTVNIYHFYTMQNVDSLKIR